MADLDSYDNFLSVLMFETFQQHPKLKITPIFEEDWIEVKGEVIDVEENIKLNYTTTNNTPIQISEELKHRWECKVGNWFKSFSALTDYSPKGRGSIRADNFQEILKKDFDFTDQQLQEANSFIEQRALKSKLKDTLNHVVKPTNKAL